jgi:hypothetical protein
VPTLKLVPIFLVGFVCCATEWGAVQRLPVNGAVEITTRSGARTKASFVSATPEAMVVREGSTERSVSRADVRRVRVPDPSRRVRNGLIWTAIGAGAGFGVGFAVCPHCASEGAGAKYTAPGVVIGAGLGALRFLSNPYRTIYQSD